MPRALAAADPTLLRCVLATITGTAHALPETSHPDLPTRTGIGRALSDREVRAELTRRLDGGSRETLEQSAPELPATLLRLIVATAVGCDLPRGYAAKIGFDLHRRRRGGDQAGPGAVPAQKRLDVTIVGAGISGLAMASELTERGVDYEILEKNEYVGGVWLENRYPDCGIDTHPYLYWWTRHRNPAWTRFDPQRAEILGNIEEFARREGIHERTRFRTEVRKADYDPERRQWVLGIVEHGVPRQLATDVLVCAVGPLNRPFIPEIPGLQESGITTLHTARWKPGLDLAGKNVGIVGTGSSGVQVARRIAETSDTLTIFQRSPVWISPRPAGGAGPVSDEQRWLFDRLPFYEEWYKFTLYWELGDRAFDELRIDSEWTDHGVSEANERVRTKLIAYIRDEVGGDDQLISELTPDYPPYAKRLVNDNDWYRTLTRPDVELVRSGIVSAGSGVLRTGDGRGHRLDVLIFATGFHSTRFLWPMEIRNAAGQSPAEVFGGEQNLRSYLGVSMPGFPNLFTIQGPNSSIGHGGSATFVAECQSRYTAICIQLMQDRGLASLECRADVASEYNHRLDADLSSMVWSTPGVRSRYKNAEGRVVSNHPWTLNEFWEATREVDLSDYQWSALGPT